MRELVLTGLPDLWPQHDREALFLGPWCFAYHAKYQYEQYVEFSFVPPPPSTPADIECHSKYVADLCNRVMPGFAGLMNRVHATEHSNHFWKIVTINWMMHWVGLCYDRHLRLTQANDMAAQTGEPLRVRTINADLIYPQDWGQYNAYLCEHAYNLQIMSDLLRDTDAFPHLHCECCNIRPQHGGQSRQLIEESSRRRSILGRLKQGVVRQSDRTAASLLSRMNTRAMLGIVYGLSRWDKLWMQKAMDPFIFLRPAPNRRADSSKTATRVELLHTPLEFDCRSDFESAVQRMLPAHLPTAFLTYHADDTPAERAPSLWVSDENHGQIDRLFRTAHAVERGGRWIEIQHGGGHGHIATVGVEEAVYRTPGAFITWGWKDDTLPGVTQHPLPSPMLAKLPRHRPVNDDLLFIGTMFPAYHYRFHSLPQPEQLLAYLEAKSRFFAMLETSLRERVLYRPYLHDYGQNEIEYIRRHAPSCRIMSTGSVTDQLARTRLAVIDHPATTFLQALVMNTPVILYWDPVVNAMRESAQPFFNQLREAGILFDTPTASAEQVNHVWPNVRGWWRSANVQQARRDFCRRFARADRNWRSQWVAFLREQLETLPRNGA